MKIMEQKFNILMNKSLEEINEVIVFGAGCYGILSIYLLHEIGIDVIACMDNDPQKKGKLILDYVSCTLPSFVKDVPVIIALKDKKMSEEICAQCEQLGYTECIYFDKLEQVLNGMPDKKYLEIKFASMFDGRRLNWDNLRTFNEKLQWLKLNDRNPEYIKMVDKYEVKKYVAGKIGEQYIIPTLGVWDDFSEIDFDTLPDEFVLKCTHDSGGTVIVKDKKTFDKDKAREKLQKSLNTNYYYAGREWPYKNVAPRIIAEKYMEDNSSTELKDYKFFCFHGVPRIILTVTGGHEDESKIIRRMYNAEWKRYPVGLHGKKNEPTSEDKPPLLDEMLRIARKLSAGIKHLRVDLYIVNNKIYFGELTFYHMSGYEIFEPVEYDEVFGSFLDLNK